MIQLHQLEVVVTSVEDVEIVLFIKNVGICVSSSYNEYRANSKELRHKSTIVESSVQLVDVVDSSSLSYSDDLIGKLLEDKIIVLGIGIRKNTLGDVLTKSKIGFRCVGLCCQDNITKPFTVGKLNEHQNCKLVTAGNCLTQRFPSYLFASLRNTSLSIKSKCCADSYYHLFICPTLIWQR